MYFRRWLYGIILKGGIHREHDAAAYVTMGFLLLHAVGATGSNNMQTSTGMNIHPVHEPPVLSPQPCRCRMYRSYYIRSTCSMAVELGNVFLILQNLYSITCVWRISSFHSNPTSSILSLPISLYDLELRHSADCSIFFFGMPLLYN